MISSNDLEKALKQSWSKGTCYAPDKDKWSQDKPAFGQCLVTSLVVQYYFGGKLGYCEHHKHYWNILRNGTYQIDFTISQFPEDTKICLDKILTSEEVLSDPIDIAAKTPEKYTLLKSRVKAILGE